MLGTLLSALRLPTGLIITITLLGRFCTEQETEAQKGERTSRWRKGKMWRSPSSPQIHQKYIYMWNSSYRTPTEHWQKTSDLPKGKKLPTYLGREKEKTETKE